MGRHLIGESINPRAQRDPTTTVGLTPARRPSMAQNLREELNALSRDMRDVALLASMRNIDHEIVESALLSLRGIVASCLPDYTVVPFGSYAMGVMLHGGAVDVTLIRHDTYQTSPSPDEPQHALTQGHVLPFTPVAPLQALCDALHVAASQSSDIRYVRTAMHEYLACSLKAFELSPAPIKFHITVESSAAVQLACFVRNYIEDHPSVLPLLVFLRAVLFGEMQLPKEQINPTVLTLSVVAFFQHLIGVVIHKRR